MRLSQCVQIRKVFWIKFEFSFPNFTIWISNIQRVLSHTVSVKDLFLIRGSLGWNSYFSCNSHFKCYHFPLVVFLRQRVKVQPQQDILSSFENSTLGQPHFNRSFFLVLPQEGPVELLKILFADFICHCHCYEVLPKEQRCFSWIECFNPINKLHSNFIFIFTRSRQICQKHDFWNWLFTSVSHFGWNDSAWMEGFGFLISAQFWPALLLVLCP